MALQPPPAPQPAPGGYGWSPEPQHEDSGGGRRGGFAAGLIAALAAFGKYGIAALKFAKLGPTVVSMLVSLVLFMWIFGPLYGAGFLAMIGIHEGGHFVVARLRGLPVSAPVFLGPFGAFVRYRPTMVPGARGGHSADLTESAVVALAGPLFGIAAALALFITVGEPQTRTGALLVAVAYSGCFINLFNLVPFNPLDGGKIAGAISPWTMVVGLVAMGIFVYWNFTTDTLNPFLVVILVIGAIVTWERFRKWRRGELPPLPPTRIRVTIASIYVGLVMAAALGMSESHQLLNAAGYIR